MANYRHVNKKKINRDIYPYKNKFKMKCKYLETEHLRFFHCLDNIVLSAN